MRAVGVQAAGHDTLDTHVAERLDVLDHRAELDVGVEKIAAARADHDEEGIFARRCASRTTPTLGVSPPSISEAHSSTRSAPAFWAATRPSVFSTQISMAWSG